MGVPRHYFFVARREPRAMLGLTVLELVVAVAVALMIATSVFTAMLFSLRVQRSQTLERRATLVAEEGLAVARFERDADWATFAGRPLETNLYPTFSGGVASLSTTDPGPVDGIFTRIVVLSSVYRDGNGNINPAGSNLDPDARRVQVIVAWNSPVGGIALTVLDAYLMKLQ